MTHFDVYGELASMPFGFLIGASTDVLTRALVPCQSIFYLPYQEELIMFALPQPSLPTYSPFLLAGVNIGSS